jgi:serine/threonine-protein kinase HipA
MSAERLHVFHGSRLAGELWLDGADRFCFGYDESWLESQDSFAISLSLPLTDRVQVDGPARFFFQNLLPEGTLRTLVCRRLGLSEGNDFGLLRAIGGECAGALSITEQDAPPADEGYRPLDEPELVEALAGFSALPRYTGRENIRLSLAGAQDKLPVCVQDGRYLLPVGGAPSSHILKLASRDFGHLPENETLCNAIATRMQVPTTRMSLERIGEHAFTLIERYDRRRDDSGALLRVHQEDMCQCHGLAPTRKYEQEGGPSFADCFGTVAETSVDPARDIESMLRWQVFNLVAGNSDGHAKNVSMIVEGRDSRRLAPFYDLVCTRIYGSLDRRLAMGIGPASDPGQVKRTDWEALAHTVGVGRRWLLDIVADSVDRIHDASLDAARTFREEHGDSPVLESIPQVIRRQSRRTGELLR